MRMKGFVLVAIVGKRREKSKKRKKSIYKNYWEM